MVKGFLKKGLFDILLGVFKRVFPIEYKAKIEQESLQTIVYKGLQNDLNQSNSKNRLLHVRINCNEKTNESRRKETRKIREHYNNQLSTKNHELEQARKSLLVNAVQEVNNYKQMRGLENVIYQQRARINRDKNDIPKVMASIFSKPPFRKIPVLMVHNKGQVYFQNPASRNQLGNLKYRNLSDYLNCSDSDKQEVTFEKKQYNAFVLPVFGGRRFDYSVVYFKQASVFSKLKHAREKDMDRAIKVISSQMKALNQKLDKKALENVEPI
tara:strand:+ start:498 stop:1304 length:807 start_codon:yes stop_codon:yes gene_type:complete